MSRRRVLMAAALGLALLLAVVRPAAAMDVMGGVTSIVAGTCITVSGSGAVTVNTCQDLATTASPTFDGLTLSVGGSSSTGSVCAVANVNTTAVGNVDGGADDLMTYSLPANTLGASARVIRITARFTGAANANSKTMTFVFGASSTAIFINSGSANTYYINFVIARSGLNTQDIWGDRWEVGGPSGNGLARVTATETETAAITIKFTGTATATDDIVQRLMIVEVCNG